ncbi:RusA family crossover junction endodeoxyribonuclease [Deinococcus apachensis]|uniref:RusA family crossover junction endodeoxyribonuclease n=1 Tax=Deinococcus apachensis TaxID=309886 RepID=UPI00037C2C93|nr:RusA family crossover junction endodeoxyribonuclease [Deinococcus apachensis]
MNPFQTRQQAEAYLSRIADPAAREATRARLLDYGYHLDEVARPTPETRPPVTARQDVVPAPGGRAQPAPLDLARVIPGALFFALPWPPSLNSIWRATVVTGKGGKPQARILLSQEGRAYRRAVKERMQAYRIHAPYTTPPGARLALTLTACPPDKRARDLSNLPKALEDALTHAKVWADDSLVDELRVVRGEVCPGGRVVVQITPISSGLFRSCGDLGEE